MYDYQKFHEKYPVDIHDDPARHIKIAELCKGVVFDIACGTGTLSDYYLGQYIGFDIATAAIAKAKDVRRKSAMFEVLDAFKLGNEDFSKADTIVISEFLEHIDTDQSIFNAILKTARKGTRIVISTPNGSKFDCDEHVRQFTVPQLRAKFSGIGRVRFYNWSGATGQIICTIDIGVPQTTEVTLAMIVKNEGKGLEKCILSAIDYVDEIIIAVDKSSSDQTHKIAEQYADVLKTYEWNDDFAAARNFAHNGAKGKWILFLDGHEYIKRANYFEEKIKSGASGLMCTIVMENGFEFQNPRLYRNGCTFYGAVHEKQSLGKVEFYNDFVIQHDRLGSQSEAAAEERKKQRNEMVPRIMIAQYKKDKKNVRATFHLGMHYVGNGKINEAIKWFRRYLKYSKCSGERWFVYFHMSLCMLAKGRLFRAFWYCSFAESEVPGRWEIEKLKGMIFFQKGKYSTAANHFVQSFKNNKGRDDYKPWIRDNAGTWNSIGECFFRLGNNVNAHMAFRRAADSSTNEVAKKFFNDRANLMKELSKSQ